MRKAALLLMALSLSAGCAPLKKGGNGSLAQRYAQSRRLEEAEEMLRKGNSAAAATRLKAVLAGPSVPEVTDEALFRLALLSLKSPTEKGAPGQGEQLLKRLKKEYPKSPWTLQAAPIMELLEGDDELREQNRGLKAANQSLGKEVSDLNGIIGKLKRLDLEIEQRRR